MINAYLPMWICYHENQKKAIQGHIEYIIKVIYIDGNDFLKVYSLGSELDPKHKTKIYFVPGDWFHFVQRNLYIVGATLGLALVIRWDWNSRYRHFKKCRLIILKCLTRPTMLAEGWQCWLLHWAGCARRETRRVFIVKTLRWRDSL